MQSKTLKTMLEKITDTWQERLMQRIAASGRTAVDIYRKAHISKQTFSKIKNCKNRTLDKQTALALAVGLELDVDEAVKFLAESGHAFSDINLVDIIVKDYISRKKYNITEINLELDSLDLPLIGEERNKKAKNLKSPL